MIWESSLVQIDSLFAEDHGLRVILNPILCLSISSCHSTSPHSDLIQTLHGHRLRFPKHFRISFSYVLQSKNTRQSEVTSEFCLHLNAQNNRLRCVPNYAIYGHPRHMRNAIRHSLSSFALRTPSVKYSTVTAYGRHHYA